MNINDINEIIACLPDTRTLFYYSKDYYAIKLLENHIGSAKRIADIQKNQYARLLRKPALKDILSQCGDGMIYRGQLHTYHYGKRIPFALTVDSWGEDDHRNWNQTSREGCNLVLQINFNNEHKLQFHRYLKLYDDSTFNYFFHPIYQHKMGKYQRQTLSWVRMDLDFNTNEALIEEIQSDWMNEIAYLKTVARKHSKNNPDYKPYRGESCTIRQISKYIDQALEPYINIWQEASLTAAIQFIYQELGIKNIFYHSFATKIKLLNMKYSKPPKSIYSRLPEKFCFEKTNHGPKFLLQCKLYRRIIKKIKNQQWYLMQL